MGGKEIVGSQVAGREDESVVGICHFAKAITSGVIFQAEGVLVPRCA